MLSDPLRRGQAAKPAFGNEPGAFEIHALGVDAKEVGNPLRLAAALIARVLIGALGEHGGEQHTKERGSADDPASTLDNELEETSRDFDDLIAGVLVQVVKHDLDAAFDPLGNRQVIEVLSKRDPRVRDC